MFCRTQPHLLGVLMLCLGEQGQSSVLTSNLLLCRLLDLALSTGFIYTHRNKQDLAAKVMLDGRENH